METEQRQYFIRRLNEIQQEKLEAKARELFGPSGRPQQPTWGQVFEAIRAGEITLKPGTENEIRAYLNPSDVEWPAMESKKTALEEYRVRLQVERQQAEDSVMLDGVAQEVLTRFQGIE
jgi:hypothetical protein